MLAQNATPVEGGHLTCFYRARRPQFMFTATAIGLCSRTLRDETVISSSQLVTLGTLFRLRTELD